MGARNMARPTFSKARKGRYRCAGAGWWGRPWFWAGSLRLRVVDYAAQLGHELRHIFNGERAHIEHGFGFGGDYICAEAGVDHGWDHGRAQDGIAAGLRFAEEAIHDGP